MGEFDSLAGTVVITGASGQDGYYLTRQLLAEGWNVHVTIRQGKATKLFPGNAPCLERLNVHVVDLLEPGNFYRLVAELQPDEIYNLAGQSSVAHSFVDPKCAYQTNTAFVVGLLECIRLYSPRTRFYQASSTDMFGYVSGGSVIYNENSALNPQSPYASAKAAAHIFCRTYRQTYGLRIACGILSNHESRRRRGHFLTRKIVSHVGKVKGLNLTRLSDQSPLLMGNLKIRRDWGFAPDYTIGMTKIIRQVSVRSEILGNSIEPDEGIYYRDYVLGTGQAHAVWELVDRAFALAGFELEWRLESDDLTRWGGFFKLTGTPAVSVDPALLRPSDPMAIEVDPSCARRELGWIPRTGVDVFLSDMFAANND